MVIKNIVALEIEAEVCKTLSTVQGNKTYAVMIGGINEPTSEKDAQMYFRKAG